MLEAGGVLPVSPAVTDVHGSLPFPTPLLARNAQRLFFTEVKKGHQARGDGRIIGGRGVSRYCCGVRAHHRASVGDLPILYVRGCSLALASDDSINGNPRRRPGICSNRESCTVNEVFISRASPLEEMLYVQLQHVYSSFLYL